MTRNKAVKFIESLVNLRGSATDKQAIEANAVYPIWKEDVAYVLGDRVLHNDVLYKVLTAHTSQATWTPDVSPSLFAVVLIPDEDVIPEWVQPDSTNPYMIGDKVTYNGKIYISIVDNNVWAPDAYGWEEYSENS
jgi:chitodextrinase